MINSLMHTIWHYMLQNPVICYPWLLIRTVHNWSTSTHCFSSICIDINNWCVSVTVLLPLGIFPMALVVCGILCNRNMICECIFVKIQLNTWLTFEKAAPLAKVTAHFLSPTRPALSRINPGELSVLIINIVILFLMQLGWSSPLNAKMKSILGLGLSS